MQSGIPEILIVSGIWPPEATPLVNSGLNIGKETHEIIKIIE